MPEQNKRIAEAKRVADKVALLQAAGAQACHLHRGSPCATAVWGSGVTGLADSKLHGLRVAALKSEGRLAAGTCLALKLRVMPRAVTRDPLIVHSVEVAKTWATGVTDGLLHLKAIEVVHANAVQLLGVRAPWTRCTDPAQAAVLCFARAGCQLVQPTQLLDHRSRQIYLQFFFARRGR